MRSASTSTSRAAIRVACPFKPPRIVPPSLIPGLGGSARAELDQHGAAFTLRACCSEHRGSSPCRGSTPESRISGPAVFRPEGAGDDSQWASAPGLPRRRVSPFAEPRVGDGNPGIHGVCVAHSGHPEKLSHRLGSQGLTPPGYCLPPLRGENPPPLFRGLGCRNPTC